ncbi:MAG: chemotaxis protein CheW [Bacteroidales bacterium]|nr:chemotaxis protein CheW [Bacteroidales bacterium]
MENYSGATPYLSFWLNEELYAYRVEDVIEVLEMQKITMIPKTPDYIMGVINFRGEILPVIDVRKKCGLDSSQDFDTKDCVIVVLEINKDDQDNSLTVGSIVESVSDVVQVKPIDIMDVPEFDTKINADLTEGIFRHDNKFITILDTTKIFSLSYTSSNSTK